MSANKKAESAAKHQAKLTQIKRDEELRQQQAESKRQHGTAVAAVGASGILQTGSSQRYINAIDYANAREAAFMKEAARKEQRAIRKGGQGLGDSLIAQGIGQVAQIGATAFGDWRASQSSPADTLGGEWAGNDPFAPGGGYGT
jgi:hypothetical protein